ncbi:Sulfotransferase domain [Macleaya cordata]|uniref:Sulfotransferase n=1 Tax=Macleaya cordata TaxID=56857 RepID=A0A200QN29_MACCD|nr:Sulfotransferase domain [Macleaya cordata]
MGDLKTLANSTSNSPEITSLLSQLPRAKWWEELDLYLWEGAWYFPSVLESTLAFRSHFDSSGTTADFILASNPKTGTTWLKALASYIMNCTRNNDGGGYVIDENVEDPLLKNHPHELVKTLECVTYLKNQTPDLSAIPSPRLFHTHLGYNVLLESIKNSTDCKIVYVVRNPNDTFISLWHFMNSARTPEQGIFPIEEAFENFCNGVYIFGPFFDHVLGYWKESLNRPNKVMFIKYEEMKKNPREQVKKLASFLGRPLASDEEVDKVVWRCSIDRLKNLEVNKYGMSLWDGLSKSSFFRIGTVGDWKNYFTSEMKERLEELTRSSLEGSGLNFEIL